MTTYTFEGSNVLAPLTIESNEPIQTNTSLNLRTSRSTTGAQRWEVSFRTDNTNEADRFVAMTSGRFTGGEMIMPQLGSVKNRYTLEDETLSISAAASAGDNSITLAAVPSGQNNQLLPKGYFFKISGHDKIYMVTSDATADSSSTWDVSFFPDLIEDVANTETLNTGDEAEFNYYQDPDTLHGIRYNDGLFADSGTIQLIEDF